MRLLLDTHLLLWSLAEPGRLDPATRDAIEDPANEVFFSAASVWEIAIKSGLGRADFRIDPGEVASAAVEAGLAELPVTAEVAARVAGLPARHRDPFDRLLVAQAMAGPMRLLMADAALPAYSELVTLVGT